MQFGSDAAKEAEGERGDKLDQPSPGPFPRASDEQDGLDPRPQLSILANRVPPMALYCLYHLLMGVALDAGEPL
eukprot:5637603-Ditylum_brightwellii.AAC.1